MSTSVSVLLLKSCANTATRPLRYRTCDRRSSRHRVPPSWGDPFARWPVLVRLRGACRLLSRRERRTTPSLPIASPPRASRGTWDAAHASLMARLGFNVVRLGMTWKGLEPGTAPSNDPAICTPGTPQDPGQQPGGSRFLSQPGQGVGRPARSLSHLHTARRAPGRTTSSSTEKAHPLGCVHERGVQRRPSWSDGPRTTAAARGESAATPEQCCVVLQGEQRQSLGGGCHLLPRR